MAKYRIVKRGEWSYDPQKKYFLLGWMTLISGAYPSTIARAKEAIDKNKNRNKQSVVWEEQS